jgi:hypothetical protein
VEADKALKTDILLTGLMIVRKYKESTIICWIVSFIASPSCSIAESEKDLKTASETIVQQGYAKSISHSGAVYNIACPVLAQVTPVLFFPKKSLSAFYKYKKGPLA